MIFRCVFCDTSGMRKSRHTQQDELDQQGLFDYEIDENPLEAPVTSYAGLPAIVETLRVLGGSEAVQQHVRLKERKRGFTEAQLVEAFVALVAAGGGMPRGLRGDAG